ncbi:hypothetical protein GCM10025331_83550 [Actinoplanes utahensis]|nr:hypothetical protein Aut01nite_84520 [Actinoplanes utahensis]
MEPVGAIVVVARAQGLATAVDRWTPPEVTLFGDGSAVLRGPVRDGMMTGRVRDIPADRIRELYRIADRAGLFRGRVHDRGDIVDAGALTVRITDDHGSHETVVVGPEAREGGIRGRVLAFPGAVRDSGVDGGDYLPERYAVVDPSGTRPCRVLEGSSPAENQGAGLVIRPLLPNERTCADL